MIKNWYKFSPLISIILNSYKIPKKILKILLPKKIYNLIWNLISKNILEPLYRTIFYGETKKAKKRRLRDGFFEKYMNGHGIDIGWEGDKVVRNCDTWGLENGDGTFMKGIKDEIYDFVYSSHTLEHINDTYTAIKNWIRILKVNKYLILYLPDRDLYEKKKELPSNFNKDHKHFFTMYEMNDSNSTIAIIPFIKKHFPNLELIYKKRCDFGYINPGPNEHSGGEYSIELVYKKIF